MPVFNTEESYLRQAIESILAQSFLNFELIVVNDASTNNAAEVIGSYHDERIKYILNDKNLGLPASRNVGYRIACGEYITFIDSDDWIEADNFAKIVQEADAGGIDVLFYEVCNVDDKTREVSAFDDFRYLAEKQKDCRLEFGDYRDFLFRISQIACAKLFRKDFLIKNDLSFCEGIIFEDTEFFFRYMMCEPRIKFVRGVFYYYRRNVGTSIVSVGNERFFDIIKVYVSIKKSLEAKQLFKVYKKEFYENKLWCFNHRYENIAPHLKSIFKKLIRNDLIGENLSPQDIKQMDKITQDYYKKFSCPYYGVLKYLKKFLNIFFVIKDKSKHKIVRILFLQIKLNKED